jgi:hypothetical protein
MTDRKGKFLQVFAEAKQLTYPTDRLHGSLCLESLLPQRPAGDTGPMQVFTARLGLALMMLMASGLELNKRLGTPGRVVAV